MTRNRRLAITILSFAALALAASIAGVVVHRRNSGRAVRYEQDPSCRTALISPSPGSTPCVAEVATIAARWKSSFKSTPHYHLALRTADGLIDSVELQGYKDADAFNAAAALHELLVQRYRAPADTHVTLIQLGMLAVRTQWNPGWRGNDSMAGVVFFGFIALGLGAWGLVLLRRS